MNIAVVDTHIELILDPHNNSISGKGVVIVEVTERSRRLAALGLLPSNICNDWSTQTLRGRLLGRWVKFSGWLYYDPDHHQETWQVDPQNHVGGTNWRQTSWEIHPVMGIEANVQPPVAMEANVNSLTAAMAAPPKLPRPDHIVIVIEENKGFSDIIGSPNAPYINNILLPLGASLTNFYALHHPSQPNYIELFSGGTQGVFNDVCPPVGQNFARPSLGGLLLQQQKLLKQKQPGFVGYAEKLPAAGSNWEQGFCKPST